MEASNPLTTPLGNVVLDALAPGDRAALLPHLVEMHVTRGQVLIRQLDPVAVVHIPISADLSNRLIFSDGHAVETTSVGRDGISGLAAFLADAPIAWEVMVQTDGIVLALDTNVLRRQTMSSPKLLELLLRVTHENQSQAAQIVACTALHDVTQRLARWLLMVSDRTGRVALSVTQEDVAIQLGVRRSTVNKAAQTLRTRKAIHFTRGQLKIVDRHVLESIACECYRAQAERAARFGLQLSAPRSR